MTARQLIEAVVGVPQADLDRIVATIQQVAQGAADVHEFEAVANAQLAAEGIRFDRNDPELVSVGMPARSEPGLLVVRTPTLAQMRRIDPRFRNLLSHELVHVEQMKRAKDTGDVDRMYTSSMKRMFPQGFPGPLDREKYMTDKQELMAYARSLIDDMRDHGMNREEMLAGLRRSVPHPMRRNDPESYQRFLRYAVAYAEQEAE